MKNKIITVSILTTSLVVLLLIGFGLFQSIRLTEAYRRASLSSEITRTMMAFVTANYKSQLEILEYFYYKPSESKKELLYFRETAQARDELFEKLAIMAEKANSILYDDGLGDIEIMRSDLDNIKKMSSEVIAKVEKYRIAKENGGVSVPVLEKMYEDLQLSEIASDELFDEIGFDKKADRFVESQGKKLVETGHLIDALQYRIKIIMVILAGVYMVLLVLIAVWLDLVIRDTKKKYIKSQS